MTSDETVETSVDAAALEAPPRRRGAPVVAPSSRVNVAFPFSSIQVQEPSRELAELSAIVVELVGLIDAAAPSPELTALGKKAQALAQRLG